MKNLNLFVLLSALISSIWAGYEPLDRILATVDGDIILESDLMQAVYQYQNVPGFSGLGHDELRLKVLNQLIDDKVVLARADFDTLSATPDELKERVDQHMEQLAQRQGMSMEAMAQAIKAQMGITLKTFKKQLEEKFAEQIALQKVRQRYIPMKTPTPKEVQAFYEGYKDSLPLEFDSYRLSHIQFKIQPSRKIIDSVRLQIDSVVAKLNQGVDFALLAEKYSGDENSKYSGGDLGFIKKGALDPLYERKAFSMEQGQFTEVPVHTDIGYHLIKVLSKKDNEIRTAQILFPLSPSLEDSLQLVQEIDSLQKVITFENFAEHAKKLSQDKLSKNKGGDLGWFAAGELNPEYRDAVINLKKGEFSKATYIQGSFHLFLLKDYVEERKLNLEDDWSKIQEFATQVAQSEKLKTFVQKWRKLVFIDIRDQALAAELGLKLVEKQKAMSAPKMRIDEDELKKKTAPRANTQERKF